MKKKWLIVFGLAMAAMFVANHAEYYCRARNLAQQSLQQGGPVIRLAANEAGHTSIQIDEQSLDKGEFLHFNALESWAFNKDAPTPCPQAIAEANGRQVKIMGFMYPLQESGSLKVFCLLRSTQTCCYGPRPQYNQYVFVEMPQPVKFDRLAPVVVEGRFFVDPRPDEGYIYRLEGQSVRPAMQSDQPITAEEFARQNNLPIFDFAPLEGVKAAADREAEIAAKLLPLDGKPMVVHGFVMGRPKEDANRILIGHYAWDGNLKGTPPTLYNAVAVLLAGPRESPPLWWQEAVFKGVLRVCKDPSERARRGVVSLHDATLAISRAQASLPLTAGPMLPVVYEMVLLAVFIAAALTGSKTSKSKGASSSSTGDQP